MDIYHIVPINFQTPYYHIHVISIPCNTLEFEGLLVLFIEKGSKCHNSKNVIHLFLLQMFINPETTLNV